MRPAFQCETARMRYPIEARAIGVMIEQLLGPMSTARPRGHERRRARHQIEGMRCRYSSRYLGLTALCAADQTQMISTTARPSLPRVMQDDLQHNNSSTTHTHQVGLLAHPRLAQC